MEGFIVNQFLKKCPAGTFRDLTAYKKAFALAMDIFRISKKFPPEEKYSLTDQIRRSSRSVCSNIGEAYRKRHYPAHFVSKSTDAGMENTETQVWLDFALSCEYISKPTWDELEFKSEEVGKLLNHMIENPEKYFRKQKNKESSKRCQLPICQLSIIN